MEIGIEKLEYYLPDTVITAADYFLDLRSRRLYDRPEREINDFIKTAGLNEVRIAPDRTGTGLVDALLEKTFTGEGPDPGSIDLVVFTVDFPESRSHAVIYPLYFLKKYSIDRASYVVMNQQCGSQLTALHQAYALIASGRADKIAIISHNHTPDMRERLIEGYGILGDGAALAVVSRNCGRNTIQEFVTVTDSSYYNLRQTPKAGAPYLRYLQNGIESIRRLALKSGKNLARDFKRIIPQNINRLEWDIYCSRLDYPRENVFLENVSKYGHVGDADALINLKDVLQRGDVNAGDNLIIHSVGAGATFNSLWIQG